MHSSAQSLHIANCSTQQVLNLQKTSHVHGWPGWLTVRTRSCRVAPKELVRSQLHMRLPRVTGMAHCCLSSVPRLLDTKTERAYGPEYPRPFLGSVCMEARKTPLGLWISPDGIL